MYEDDPQDLVFDVLGEAIFGDTSARPRGDRPRRGGRRRDARAAAAFHAERYVPENIVIAAAGWSSTSALVALARARRPAASPRRAARRAAAGAAPAADGAARAFGARTPSSTTCALGGPGLARDDERRFALRVLEGVLGGTSSSRLFQEVRERRGLAYSVFTFPSLYAHTGEVGLYVGTRPENLAEALRGDRRRAGPDPRGAGQRRRSSSALAENLKGRIVLALESTGAR